MIRPKLLIFLLTTVAVVSGAQVGPNDSQLRRRVPANWWESASAIVRVSINPDTEGSQGKRPQFPMDPAKAGPILDDYKARGVSAIEIFAPYHGGNSFGGLDPIDRFNLNPKVGTMDDFRALVRLIHSKGMAVISFDNLGYSSSESPEFLKACDDVRAGKDTAEARRFLWADRADAPPPAPDTNKFFMVRPRHLPGGYDAVKGEFWEYSERAGKYFWTKWAGPDLSGKVVRLPQYNWRDEEFQQYMERVVRFWMDTGLDGMIIDAVNWYVGHTWEQDRHRLTDVIRSYGNAYMQPEGGGAFHEDPVAWITEGGWNSVQDYGLGIFWEKDSLVVQHAIDDGDPRPIERALLAYHDRVATAGGVMYVATESHARYKEPEKQRLALAVSALAGNMVGVSPGEVLQNKEIGQLLKMKAEHPAFYNNSARRHIPTDADDKHYAFLRSAKDNSERVLVVMNFQSTPQTVAVDLSGVSAESFVELGGGESFPRKQPLNVELAPFAYRLYEVK